MQAFSRLIPSRRRLLSPAVRTLDVLGPRVHGIYKQRIGAERSNEDGRPGGFYIPRFRNLDEKSKAKDFIRGYGLEGSSGQEMFPEDALKLAGYGQAYKRKVRDHAGAFLYMYGLGEVLPRYENRVELDPHVKDAWGIPVLRFSYKYGDNEKKMCADMVASIQEAFATSGFEITRVDRDPLTEGSSVHELGTARMGDDPKTSVLNPFLQSHDVKNLFVVDGAGFVSAACQNPTWTIMALCWRSCDYLAGELKRGEL
jgi:choline dehydrogenase-like flavoprotein